MQNKVLGKKIYLKKKKRSEKMVSQQSYYIGYKHICAIILLINRLGEDGALLHTPMLINLFIV